MLSQSVRLTLLSRSIQTSPAVVVGMARLMLHSGEPAGCFLSLEQRPVNPWTRSTWGLSKEASTACPMQRVCAVVVEGRWCGHLTLMLPGFPEHACNLPGSSQKPSCCRRKRSATATLNCMLGYACLPQGEGQLPKHTCLMAACWGKTQCARATAQLCHAPARSQRSPTRHPSRGGPWTNLSFLLLPSLP